MNNAFHVSQSKFGSAEESSFKKRWTYRPKSQHPKTQRRVVIDSLGKDEWECLTGWDLAERSNFDVPGNVDIVAWVKQLKSTKKDDASDRFMFSVFVTCPSIFNYDKFKAASLGETSPRATEVKGGSLKKTVNEAVQVDIIRDEDEQQKRNTDCKAEIESLQSCSTISCNSGELRPAEEEEAGKDVTKGKTSSFKQGEVENRGCDQNPEEGDQSNQTDVKYHESQPVNERRCESSRGVKQKPVVKPERRISSANNAAGDGGKQNGLRKQLQKKPQPKKVTLNPAPIEILYPEDGSFEINNSMKEDDDVRVEPLGKLSNQQCLENTGQIVSLRTPDRTAWENSLKQESGLQLPSLSDLSIGDLLTNTPRLQQLVENTDSRLSYIQSLYNRNPTSSVTSLENITPPPESHLGGKLVSSFPSLRAAGGSPQNLVSSGAEDAHVVTHKENGDKGLDSHPDSSNGQQNLPSNIDSQHSVSASSKNDLSGNKPVQNIKGKVQRRLSSTQKIRATSAIPTTNQQRGPPAFRPHSNKTPLQRAMENAHKRIYGDHHYLFSTQSVFSGKVEASPAAARETARETRLRQTKSALNANKTTNAYTWRERLDRNIKQQRTIYNTASYIGHNKSSHLAPLASNIVRQTSPVDWSEESAKLVTRLSSSTNTIDPSVQIFSKAELRNAHLQSSYSELFRLARQKKLQVKTVTDKYYTLSDFKAPLENRNVLRTERDRLGQKNS